MEGERSGEEGLRSIASIIEELRKKHDKPLAGWIVMAEDWEPINPEGIWYWMHRLGALLRCCARKNAASSGEDVAPNEAGDAPRRDRVPRDPSSVIVRADDE